MAPGERLLLFLPMSNFQQRNMCYAALWYDFDIIITDYTQLFAAMLALNPTVLIAPPVLYQMIHAEYEKYPGWKRALWNSLGSGAFAVAFGPRAPGDRPRALSRFLQAVRQPHAAADHRHGADPAQHRQILRPAAAASVRILRHGRGRLHHLPPRQFARIWLGGQAAERHPDINRTGWGNHRQPRQPHDLALFPVRRRRKRTHLYRARQGRHRRHGPARCRWQSLSAGPQKRAADHLRRGQASSRERSSRS